VTHREAAAFALDALDTDELAEFERHLESCPACEDELEGLQVAAAALAFVVDLPAPRPELRSRVVDTGAPVIALRRRLRPRLAPVAAALAACAAIVLAIGPWRDGGSIGGMDRFDARGSQATLLVGEAGEAILVARRLPPPPAGMVYEVWVTARGGATRPAGELRGSLAALTRPVPRGATVAVSAEPVGGSQRPTGPLVVQATTT
jgi:anti-sigma-K factor RskA